jgi:methyl-accepting chemotaxis protein
VLKKHLQEEYNLYLENKIEVATLKEFSQSITKYETIFQQLVKSQEVIGLSEKVGLYGALRDSVHKVQDSAKTSGDFELLAKVYELRKNEKDFMLRRNMKYVKEYQEHLEALLSNTSGNVKDDLEVYKKDFLNLVQEENHIGLNEKVGLQGNMRDTVHKTEKQLKNLDITISKIIVDKITESFTRTLIITIVLIIIVFIFSVLVLVNITQSLKHILETARNLSSGEGDLTKRLKITSKDEIGAVASEINRFIEKVQLTINAVKQASHENSSIAEKLHGSSENVKSNIVHESTIIRNATKNIVEISSSLLSSVDVAKINHTQIENASSDLTEATNKINDLTQKINQTSETEQELSIKLEELSNNATEIKSVLNVIADIADQTNLLALNAAIEAARAGEHGRGFAVVADEVRKLAENTQRSLSEINASVSVIVQSILEASTQMNENAKTVTELVDISTDVETTISSSNSVMLEALKASSTTMKESQKMAQETTVISKEIENINDISNQNSKSVSEITIASSLLNQQTAELNTKLDKFRT